jgi:hypothetical protein
LPQRCREFRAAFVPNERAEDGSHRASCPRCERWAAALEAQLAPDVRRPLPTNLAERLRAIPESTFSCDATEALYAEARRRATGRGSGGGAAAQHLERCTACRRLYGVLEDTLLEAPRPLPSTLRASLNTLATPWAPPRWLRDVRYAAAVCLLLASSLTFVVGDAAAALRRAEDTVRTVRTTVGDSTLTGGRWESFEAHLASLYREGRLWTSQTRSDLYRLGHQTLEELTTRMSQLSVELGDPMPEETKPSPSQGDR